MRILIVDDHPANLKLLRAVLESENYSVVDATDGMEALRALEAGMVDAIISDILMPNLDGFALCQRVRAHPRFQTLPFIFYTSTYNSASDEKTAYLVGGDKYLVKPSPASVMLAALHEVTSEAKYRQQRAVKPNGELVVMREYNAALVRKLEEKNTELGHTLASLVQSEQRFREMLGNVNLIAMTLDQRAKITFCNDYLLRLTGWSRDEVIGADWFEKFIPGSDSETKKLFFDTIDAGLTPAHRENPMKTKSGELRHIVWNNTILRDAAGNILGTASIGEDVTDRRRAEQSLRASEERFRQVVENIREVFWMTDVAKNQMLYISPGYEEIWGRTCESLYASALTWIESIYPEDRARVLHAATTKQVRGDYDETYRIVRPDGTVRWVRDRAFPINDETGAIVRVVGVAEDITEQRRLEEQFRQAQKMEAIGTLAGGIAHDFNNVLAAISGYTELTKMEVSGNPTAIENLDAVLHGARRAADLVRQILTFSRRQELERKPIQLRQVVGEALKLLRATIPAPIEFEVALATDTPNVFADTSQIHQIMMNLCTNAAHAMKEGPGRLTVKLENFEVEAEFVTAHPGLRPGRHALLSVSDTGSGMDATTLNRIFEPFFTTKAPGEGTGLGLAVVHGIMQSHDGAVTVYSHPGEGTTFHLYFPAHAGGGVEAVIATGPVPRGNGERILYVDDEAPLATMGKKILERLGYVVDARTKAFEALEALRANPTAFDLVVTDQMMPGMTGLSLAERIQLVRPDLPIILITGYTATLTAERVQAMGIQKLLLKPISVETLGTVVGRVLAETKPR